MFLELSDEQKLQFRQLLLEFPDVFSKDDFDLDCLNSGVEHKLTHMMKALKSLGELHSSSKNKNRNILKNY